MAKIIVPAPYNTWLSLKEATERMGYKHAQYVRKLVQEGKLGDYGTDYVKVDMGAYQQWLINPESADAYRDSTKGTFGSQGGIRRFLVRVDSDRLDPDQIKEVLEAEFGPSGDPSGDDHTYEFGPAWTGKSKTKKAKPKEDEEEFTARILDSLTNTDDEYDDDEDEDDPLA